MTQPGPGDGPKPPDGRTLLAGATTIALYRWTAQALSWAATLIVLRLLTPAEYGIASLAGAVIAIASVLSEFGLGTAVVALPDLEDRTARQLHGASVLLALGVGLVCAASAPLLASFYSEPALIQVIPVLSLIFLAEGARLVPLSLLSRALAYRSTALYDFLRSIFTAALVIVLAWQGAGYWALVLGNLFGATLSTVPLLLRHGIAPAWPRLAELRGQFQMARDIVIGRIAWSLYRNSDFLVAGRLFGATPLGHYTMAWNVASLPGEKLGHVLTAATLPFFSALQKDRPMLRHYFLQVTEALALVLVPVLLGFFAVADLAVPLVLGEQWIPAVPVLRVLVIYATGQAVNSAVNQILLVTGQSRISMHGGLIGLAVLPAGFVAGGLLWGPVGVAAAWVLLYPVTLGWPLHHALRALNLTLAGYLRAALRAFESAAVMLLAVALTRRVLDGRVTAWVILGASVAVGGLGYVGWLWLRHGAVLKVRLSGLRGR